MLRSLFSQPSQSSQGGVVGSAPATSKPATLLVLQGDDYDWPAMLKGERLADGRGIRVVQTGWEDIGVHCDTYSTSHCCVEVFKLAKTAFEPEFGTTRCPFTVQPDFVLIRNEVRTAHFDGRSLLNGLLFADVPSMNSLQSVLLFCERPAVQGQLHRLRRRFGPEVFPVVPQHYASTSRTLMYGYTFPAVVKVGSAHAGVGKMKIHDHHQMSDFRSVLAMMPSEHCFAEPFIEGEVDLRIQRIGGRYRAFKRFGISGDWKTNTGSAVMEEIDCCERWRRWADLAAEMFGGLDILTVDAIVEAGTGQELILEVNGTSSGLHPDKAGEDNRLILELLLEKMNAELCTATG